MQDVSIDYSTSARLYSKHIEQKHSIIARAHIRLFLNSLPS